MLSTCLLLSALSSYNGPLAVLQPLIMYVAILSVACYKKGGQLLHTVWKHRLSVAAFWTTNPVNGKKNANTNREGSFSQFYSHSISRLHLGSSLSAAWMSPAPANSSTFLPPILRTISYDTFTMPPLSLLSSSYSEPTFSVKPLA